jgi:hypothetical protein
MTTTPTTTTPTTTTTSDAAFDGTKEESSEEEDSKKIITIFVKLLPEPNAEEHKNLTRFQVRDPRARYRFGKTCVFRDVEKTTETVLGVKRRVERETGEKVEMLRRGLFRFVSNRERELCSSRSSSFFFYLFDARAFFYICFIIRLMATRVDLFSSLFSLSLSEIKVARRKESFWRTRRL